MATTEEQVYELIWHNSNDLNTGDIKKSLGCEGGDVVEAVSSLRGKGKITPSARGWTTVPSCPEFSPAKQETVDSHYHHSMTVKVEAEDLEKGSVTVKMDPYRVCDIYSTGGGPREQMIKKLLRWTDKGQSEDKVLSEIESALNRWKEMRREDGL